MLVLASIVALSSRTDLLGGVHLYSVLTGSMEPTLPVNSLIVVRSVADVTTIQAGDVITFEEPGQTGRLITHRITSFESEGDQISFRTKGDANPIADAWLVSPEAIRGKVVRDFPNAGSLISFLNTPVGIALFVLLPVLILAYDDIYTIHRAMFEMQFAKRKEAESHVS